MASSVGKLGSLAGDAFSGNNELVNVFDDPVNSICRLFVGLASFVLSIIKQSQMELMLSLDQILVTLFQVGGIVCKNGPIVNLELSNLV